MLFFFSRPLIFRDLVFIVFSCLTWFTMAWASEMIRDDSNDVRHHLSPFLQDFSNLLTDEKPDNSAQCLSKNLLLANTHPQHRRASISRPYFHHWRAARENSRPSLKNFLAFSPRLGRANEDDETLQFLDSEFFGLSIFGRINEKKYSIVYEDSNKICSVRLSNEDLLGEILDKVGANRN